MNRLTLLTPPNRTMKKTALAFPVLLALTACNGTKEYDTYIEALTRQAEATDTISTPQSYAARLDSVRAISEAFDQSGVKLNEDQKAAIQALGLRLQDGFNAAYKRLASTPVTLPDAFPVPEDVRELPAE